MIGACKRQQDNPSTVVTASYPTIIFGQKYYSITVGSVRPTVNATAYDSFYKQSCQIVTIDSTIHNFVPGVYRGVIYATGQYGYTTYDTYYVAVTGVSAALSAQLAGHWMQNPLNDSISTNVTELATGLYSSSNVNGVNIYTNPTGVVYDLFALTSNTTIQFFTSGTVGTLSYTAIAGDTTMSYATPTGSVVFSK